MTKRLFIFVTLAVLVTGVPAMATTISYTTSTPIFPTTTDWSESPDMTSLAFPKFNSALGTLTKVTLELSGDMDTEIHVTNGSQSPSTGSASTHLRMYVKYTGLALGEPQINILSDPLEFTDLAPGGSASGSFYDIELSALKNYTTSAILTAFTGAGNIVLDADTITETTLSWTGGNVSGYQITDASLTGTVTYTYTVPEPATITLFCTGVLALLRRKNGK